MLRSILTTTSFALAVAIATWANAAEQAPTETGAQPEPGVELDSGTTQQGEQGEAPDAGQTQSAPDVPADQAPEGGVSDDAAQPKEGDTGMTEPQGDAAASIIPEEEDGGYMADQIIGMKVMDANGEKIGKIKDIILDEQGRMTGLVVTMGGFVGIGAKKVGIRVGDANIDLEQDVIVVATLTEETLKQAPDFKTREELEAEERAFQRRMELEQQQQRSDPPL